MGQEVSQVKRGRKVFQAEGRAASGPRGRNGVGERKGRKGKGREDSHLKVEQDSD